MKVSIIIHTASSDDFLLCHGISSYFAAVCNNLRWQTFTAEEFELCFVDAFHEENKEKFSCVRTPFQVKHVPIHESHKYWYSKGYCFISAAKNSGILYADGQLCISCDDAEFFPAHLFQAYWDHYKAGRLMHALHVRMKSVRMTEAAPGFEGETYINDSRQKHVVTGQQYIHKHGSLLFAGTSFGLEDALRVNGYNERMDGCKSLEDSEFGIRLGMIGKTFVLDPTGVAYIVDHPSYADDIHAGWDKASQTQDGQEAKLAAIPRRKIENLIAVENYSMCCIAPELMDFVANRNPLTDRHMRIIQRETLKYRKFDPLAPENKDKLDVWLGTPTFDLRKERAELRASAEWKW